MENVAAAKDRLLGFIYKFAGGLRDIKVDTITTIARVALLTLKPEGTKLRFALYSISYHKDGVGRTFSEDSHRDLYVLEKIVHEALKIFPPLQDSPQKELFIHCQSGLDKLAQIYAKNEAPTSQHMKTLKLIIESKIKCDQAGAAEDETTISQLWDHEDLEFLRIAFKKAIIKKEMDDEKLQLIKSIEAFLDAKDIAYIKSLATAAASVAS